MNKYIPLYEDFLFEEFLNEYSSHKVKTVKNAKEQKKNISKSQVMREINKDPQFIAKKKQFFQFLRNKARSISNKHGINIRLVDMKKFTLRDE